ncbi:protein translocase subunit SecD, partial [Candidatus Pelagibacter ubique]|nr:protein translocase subunit SecD [Candidatus Pelagibacter ubique]
MLYFSKLRITLVSLVSIFFIFIAASNFQNPEDSFISKKINLGLDLQGGSYLLLEIDNEPVEIQKLQNTTTVIRNFLKDKKISFNDLRIKDKKIIFSIPNDNIESVQSFFLDKESDINPYYFQYKS